MKKNNMRLLSVVMGEPDKDKRSEDTISMMEYAYSMYGSENIISKDEVYGKINISNSSKKTYDYYVSDDVNIIVNKNTKDIDYQIDKELYEVKAPLKKNSIIGKLILKYNNNKYEYDLIIKENINKFTYFEVLKNNFKSLISGIHL